MGKPTVDEANLIALARSVVVARATGRPLPVPMTKTVAVRAVFVTIENGKTGTLLGCRGTLEVRGRTLEEAVVLAATSAARHDPRYRPLTPVDVRDFKVTVTVVERLEPIQSVDGLRPADGLALQSGDKFGIVLPWEGRDPRTRLRWAFAKAGVPPNAAHRLFRVVAARFRG